MQLNLSNEGRSHMSAETIREPKIFYEVRWNSNNVMIENFDLYWLSFLLCIYVYDNLKYCINKRNKVTVDKNTDRKNV